MSRSRLQSLNSNIDHMKCSLSSKNSTEKYRGFRGSLFSIHPLSGCERLLVVGEPLPASNESIVNKLLYLDNKLFQDLACDRDLDLALARDLARDLAFALDRDLTRDLDRDIDRDIARPSTARTQGSPTDPATSSATSPRPRPRPHPDLDLALAPTSPSPTPSTATPTPSPSTATATPSTSTTTSPHPRPLRPHPDLGRANNFMGMTLGSIFQEGFRPDLSRSNYPRTGGTPFAGRSL